MNNLVRLPTRRASIQESGRVVRVEGPRIFVETQSGLYSCRRAASCLIVPAVHDLVLLARLEDGAAYVLSVLESETEGGTEISVDGDLSIRLEAGAFRVAAQDGVELVSGKRVAAVAPEIDVHGESGNVVLDQLSFLGRFARAEVETIKVVAGALDSIVERVSQTIRRSYRTITEFDQVRAERIDYVAKANMSLRAKNALVTSQQLVKVDGDQIHLG
jgi:Protein of unknown function (DUF3540)